MIRRILCLFGRHRRSIWHRYQDDDGSYRSRCRGCEVPMRRSTDGVWTVEPGAVPRRGLFGRRRG